MGHVFRRWPALAAVMIALAAQGVALPAEADPPVSRDRMVLNDVHTDTIDVQFTDGQLRLQTRIGNAPFTYAQAAEVVFQLKDVPESAIAVPDDPLFAFLGNAGDPVWLAPEVQDFALLFAGWDTESIPPGALAGDVVNLELTGVSGPGRVEVFQSGPFGEPLRVFSSGDAAYWVLHQPVHSHSHANWVFSALGRYELTFRASAVLPGGGNVQSQPVTYTWFVGGTTAADVTAIPTTTELSATVTGTQATLAAAVQPAMAQGWVEFFDGATSLGHAAVPATLTVTLRPGQRQLTARFIPFYGNDFAGSVSPVVQVAIAGPSPDPTPSGSPSATSSASPSPSASLTSPAAVPSAPVTSVAACIPSSSSVPVLNDGHADYGVRIVSGRLQSGIKDSTAAGRVTWRDPPDVVLHLKPQAAQTLPAGFGFLGSPGSTVWQIPQTQQSGILWLGWNTESLTAAQVTGTVSWSLTAVSGPGRMAVYEYDSFGTPRVIFNSGDGLPDRFDISPGTHAHGNWAFTKQGAYRLTFTHRATLASGTTVSDTETLTIVVGDTNPGPYALRTSGCGLPRTGVWVTGIAAAGGGLLLAGVVFLAIARRRRVQS